MRRIYSGNPWEKTFGYCRALRAGDIIYVSGTTARGAQGELIGKGDVYAQSVRCLEIIAAALAELDADLSCVVRTAIYVTDVATRAEVARAHSAAFGAHPPASTFVEVSALAHPDMLVEVEATAHVPR